MPVIKNNFIQGKMNKDLDDRLLPNGQYRDAQNITVSKSEGSSVGAVQNVLGNDYAYAGGTITGLPVSIDAVGEDTFSLWETIGFYNNSQTGDVFWFVTSFAGNAASDDVLLYKTAADVVVLGGSDGNDVTHDDDTTNHNTIEIANASNYDIQVGMKVTGTGVAADTYVQAVSTSSNVHTITLNKAQSGQTVLDDVTLTFTHTCRIYRFNTIQNTSPSPIIDNKRLNFSKNHHIHHVNLLDNLLFWTDNYNQPRRINIDSTSFPNDDFFEDRISVAQFAPYSAPKVKLTKVSSSTVPSLHIRDKFVKFGYRYVYDNNEVSLISPFTQTCFLPGKGKNINHGSFKSGQAGLITQAEAMATQKATVMDVFQNMVNRVHLFIDLPSEEDKNNVASADAGVKDSSITVDAHMVGAASSNQSIHSIGIPGTGQASGVIDNTTTMLTARGDKYTVASITEAADLGDTSTITFNEEIPANLGIFHNEKLYFFKPGSDTDYYKYTNPLKIKRVEIVYAESDSPAVKIVDTIKIPVGQTSLDNIIKHRAEPASDAKAKLKFGIEYVYDSTKPIKTLPEQDITRVADIVPMKAAAQEVSGNRIIYGNFKLNRPITNLIERKDNISVTSRDQEEYNSQYLLHSVKQAREYSVGLVLSDRYGRQSTVFLPTANTTYITPRDTSSDAVTPMTDTNNDGDNSDGGEGFVAANRWNGTALNIDFGATISDVYDKNTNPYGWYSYKVVVKQPQQEYYNVYVPSLIDDIDDSVAADKSSFITLFGDNINKVPRDIIDGSLDNQIASSKTKLLPRILNVDSGGIADGIVGNGHKQQTTTDFIEIISLGTTDQFDNNNTTAISNISTSTNIVNFKRKPVMAELPDGFGGGKGPSVSKLCVLETDPFISALDIYFETSTGGKLSDLNEAIQASLGSTPSGINISANTFAENIAANTEIASLTYTDTNGGSPSGESYTLESVTDGGNNDRTSEFQISSGSLRTATGSAHLGHEFRNRPEDTFSFEIKVTDSGGNEHTETKTITMTNVAPTIISLVSSTNVSNNSSSGTTVTTYSATNGAGKLSAQNNSLTFSISAGNSANKFAIGGQTGVLTTNSSSLSAGDTYSLTIRVTDVGGLFAETTLSITIISSNVKRFYRSAGNTSQSDVCDDPANQESWFEGNGTLPTEGDTIYSSSTGTSVFNGQNAWYVGLEDQSNNPDENHLKFQITTNGTVNNASLCTG